MSSPDHVLTPTQLNTLARNLLEDSFPSVWVEGELGNVTRPASGHLYFTLKDAGAQVRAAMFKLRASTLRFAPREGLRVLLRGKLTLYAPRGDYQLVVEHMEQAGEGALRRAFEQLKARLQAEGLFEPARKRELPLHPRRIAVITSPTGAAVRDVLSVLARRYPLLEVDLLPCLVQGETAAPQLTRLLRAADASGRYDVILLTRGGGSLEDLWAFNDEALTRAVAASHTPVISAVGHETDFSLTDFAADLRAPTPSVPPNCWCRTSPTCAHACASWPGSWSTPSAACWKRPTSAPTMPSCAWSATGRSSGWGCSNSASSTCSIACRRPGTSMSAAGSNSWPCSTPACSAITRHARSMPWPIARQRPASACNTPARPYWPATGSGWNSCASAWRPITPPPAWPWRGSS
jgi:exodeoxyribonuclease VII, large subunit